MLRVSFDESEGKPGLDGDLNYVAILRLSGDGIHLINAKRANLAQAA
jgi:hypothetical protein